MWVTSESYHIAAKFGGENVWKIYSFQAFGEKKFGEWISQMVINCKYYFGWLTTLDGFSLANCRQFCQIRQTFYPPNFSATVYSMWVTSRLFCGSVDQMGHRCDPLSTLLAMYIHN